VIIRQVDLMKSLDKTRKELASACQQSLLVVSSCKVGLEVDDPLGAAHSLSMDLHHPDT
jgi:hypothetical protein